MYLSLLTVLPIRPFSIRSHSEIVSAPFLPYLRLSEEKKSLAPFLITYPFRAERIPLLPYLCRWRSRPPPRRPREARPRPRGAARPLLRACVCGRRPKNFVDGTSEGRANFGLKYHHCTASTSARPSFVLLSAVSPALPICEEGDVLREVMRSPFLLGLHAMMEHFLRAAKSRKLTLLYL